MVLYYCDIREIDDYSAVSFLTPARRERFMRYRQDSDKRRCLGAGLLLGYLLGKDADLISAAPYGKLFLPESKISFNLSHSGDYVVLAADEFAVGVDIEYMGVVPEKVAQRCFTLEERNWMCCQKDVTEAFYRLWTGKESIMKATGLGFSMPPHTFSIMPPTDGLHQIQNKNWYMNWCFLDRHVLCLSSARDDRAVAEKVSFAALIQQMK